MPWSTNPTPEQRLKFVSLLDSSRFTEASCMRRSALDAPWRSNAVAVFKSSFLQENSLLRAFGGCA